MTMTVTHFSYTAHKRTIGFEYTCKHCGKMLDNMHNHPGLYVLKGYVEKLRDDLLNNHRHIIHRGSCNDCTIGFGDWGL